MDFVIDGQRRTVGIATRPLFHNGQPCKARLDPDAQRIWLSDQLPRHERRAALFHELRHHWVEQRGLAGDEEADAIAAGEMMDLVYEQYDAQGGDAVLLAMEPEREASRGLSAAVIVNRAQCGECRRDVMCGSINDGQPAWEKSLGEWIMPRWVECEGCGYYTVWFEVCSVQGAPMGAIVAHPKPLVLAGVAAGRWIREHSEECPAR